MSLFLLGWILDKISLCSQFNFYQRLLIEFSSPFIISNCFPFSCFRLFFHFGLMSHSSPRGLIERESNYGVVLINMELYLFLAEFLLGLYTLDSRFSESIAF